MDMSNPKEIFLLDVKSDATEYGGVSQTQLLHNEKEGYLRVRTKFVRENLGFELPDKLLFCGFQNNYMVKQEYDGFNGLKITMRPPPYPCKVGLHVRVSIGNEHEEYVGHILDTQSESPDKWQDYELPLSLLHQDQIMSKVVNPNVDNFVITRGLTFRTESDRQATSEEDPYLDFDIKSISMIYNPAYTHLYGKYTIPVFFKSSPHLHRKVDNGRHVISFTDPETQTSTPRQNKKQG